MYHIDWFLYVYPTLHFWDNHHFGHGTKPCLCVVLLAFCCGFLHLYLWSIVPQFAFLSISLSRFDISMFIGLLVWIEKFVFLFFFFGRVCKGLVLMLLKMFDRILQWSYVVLDFALWKVLKLLLNVFPFIEPLDFLFLLKFILLSF